MASSDEAPAAFAEIEDFSKATWACLMEDVRLSMSMCASDDDFDKCAGADGLLEAAKEMQARAQVYADLLSRKDAPKAEVSAAARRIGLPIGPIG